MITGSRGWDDLALIEAVADGLEPGSTVVVGDARGADRAFERAARERGHEVVVMRADWSTGRGAGFARNLRMLDALTGLPDDQRLVIAFWLGSSHGTRHAVREAMRRGYPLQLHWRPGPAAG